MNGDGDVARKRPGRGRPNDEIGLAEVAESRKQALIVVNLELDVDRLTGILSIFDLRFGQCRFVGRAPIHRLQALINIAFFIHFAEDLDFLRFKRRIHGQIRMIPIAEYAKSLEGGHLNADKFLRKEVAGTAKLGNAHLFAVKLILLDNGTFDRHTVVVPTRNIRRVIAGHGFGFVDKVL